MPAFALRFFACDPDGDDERPDGVFAAVYNVLHRDRPQKEVFVEWNPTSFPKIGWFPSHYCVLAPMREGPSSWRKLYSTNETRHHMRDEAIHLSYLKWGLIAYRREYGDYPDGLEAAELARYTEGQSAFDVWGNKVSYTKTADGFDIRSAGPDGIFKTDDDMVLGHAE